MGGVAQPLAGEYDERLKEAVRGLLQRDPAERWSSADAYAHLLPLAFGA